MKVVVLGSAAGGGCPQWNCRCPVCALFWQGDPRVKARTQSSVAVSADGRDWVLLNCSPDMRSQILSNRILHPRDGSRSSPIKAVALTNGDVDHIGGLLSLRERQSFTVLATEAALQALARNRIFDVLASAVVTRRTMALDAPLDIAGLEVCAFAVPGKRPLYLESGPMDSEEDPAQWSVGLRIAAGATVLFYIPGCADVPDALKRRLDGASVLLFDGTLWTDDEMMRLGVGAKTGRRMGHIPISGEDGSMACLADTSISRRIFVHINNTNPVLIAGSDERRAVEAKGWEVADDGMEMTL